MQTYAGLYVKPFVRQRFWLIDWLPVRVASFAAFRLNLALNGLKNRRSHLRKQRLLFFPGKRLMSGE